MRAPLFVFVLFIAAWMVTVPLLHYFITSYGWRLGLQILSAVILSTGLVSCIPLCPVQSKREEDNVDDTQDSKRSLKDLQDVDRYESKDLKCSKVESSEQITVTQMKVFLCKPETWVYAASILGTMSSWSFYFINIVRFLIILFLQKTTEF